MRYGILLLTIGVLWGGASVAQDAATWKVTLNKKTLLTSSNYDDTITNRLLIKREDLSNNGSFKVEYTEGKNSETKNWVRTMAVMDTNSTVMAQLDSTNKIQFYNKDMLKLLWSRKKVIVFTWAAPADKGMAAAVRIRRMRLCTLELAD